MPANCSSDVTKVIDYIDNVLLSNDTAAITTLKTKFALAGVEHNDDFASVLQNGPWEWQSNQFYTGYSDFYFFCDSVENVGELFPNATTIPGAEGVGLDKALDGYAQWISKYMVPDSKHNGIGRPLLRRERLTMRHFLLSLRQLRLRRVD